MCVKVSFSVYIIAPLRAREPLFCWKLQSLGAIMDKKSGGSERRASGRSVAAAIGPRAWRGRGSRATAQPNAREAASDRPTRLAKAPRQSTARVNSSDCRADAPLLRSVDAQSVGR
jgi:hypothetical protein